MNTDSDLHQFREETFTPAEVAQMTGVPVSTQSNWRRLGYVEGTGTGWNKWSLFQAAGFAIMMHLAARGIGLQKVRLPVGAVDVHNTAEVADAVRSSAAAAGAYRALIYAFRYPGAVLGLDGNATREPPIKTPLDWDRRYLFVFGDGRAIAINELADLDPDLEFESAALIDLQFIGTEMAARAARPLAVLR